MESDKEGEWYYQWEQAISFHFISVQSKILLNTTSAVLFVIVAMEIYILVMENRHGRSGVEILTKDDDDDVSVFRFSNSSRQLFVG